jgi:ClpP class serine protease
MASAAMWIGAAGNHVMATPTASVGSIGVYYSHFDFSELNTKMGIKVTEIVSGKWKGLGSEDRPLSKDDKNKIQEQVDYLATTFISDVARFRNLQPEKVAALEAGVLFGEEALKVGLIDAVGTFDDALEKARELSKKTSKTRVVMKTLQDQLKAQFPDHESCIDSVCAQAKVHFLAEHDKETEGLKAEKDTEITALKSQVDEATAALAAAKDTISRLTAVAVDNVWKAALSGTVIPENLHADMKALIAVPDDGQLDITAFAAAVTEKVALWEKNFNAQQAPAAAAPMVDGHGAPDAEAEAPPTASADEGYTAEEIKARKFGTGQQ